MSIDYTDPYLLQYCSYEIEQRAIAHVESLGTFTQASKDKLTVLYAYIIICKENLSAGDDLFTKKLKIYEKDFDGALSVAETESPDDDGNYSPVFSIPLERA